ncbi:MAG TPA: A/G-specific adenine glycosylase [Chloroflexota bacterium]
MARVQAALLGWYAREARDLPWRRTRDPYAILVAEIMLQQTQVDRVLPRWRAWLDRFPTLADLAAASRADAIRAWQGLGYNRRAARLHAIACQVMTDYAGELPRSVEELMGLEGIGRYTAGAVACFAYEQPVSMVDTNIRRVLSRVFAVEAADVESVAAAVVPPEAAYAWNQALMDLGASLCRSQRPLCLVCPLLAVCDGPRGSQSRARAAQPEFKGSARFYRGRILDALRQIPPGETIALDELAERVDNRRELIFRLASEGLVHVDDAQARVRLAE